MRSIKRMLAPGLLAALAVALSGCAAYDRMMGQSLELTGTNEVPPVQTSASGTAHVRVKDDCSVSGTIKISGMKATAAHIHTGGPGENGPVAVGFVKTSETTFKLPDGARLTPSQCQAYKAGDLYVNVHSVEHKNGELRAQLRPERG